MTRHIVAEGQAVQEIASHYGVSAEELIALNALEPTTRLVAGMMLWVPAHSAAPQPPAEATLIVPSELFAKLKRSPGAAQGRLTLRIRPGKGEHPELRLD